MRLSAIVAVLVSIVFLVVLATKAGQALTEQSQAFASAQQALLDANI